jgi:hypothetical protein
MSLPRARLRRMVPRAGLEPARPFGQRIFLPSTAFAAAQSRLGSGMRHDHGSLVDCFRPPPSTLYTCQRAKAHPGLARRCLGSRARGFADFDGLQTSRFHTRRSQSGSPLRLPITSPGQGSSVSQIHCSYAALVFLAVRGRRPDVTSFSGFFISKCNRPSTMRDE